MTAPKPFNPYAVLGVRTNAGVDAIKKAFRKKSMKAHPDHGGDAEAFAEIKLAYDILSDPGRRARFDETGEFDKAPIANEDAGAINILGTFLQVILAGEVEPHTRNIIADLRSTLDKQLEKIASDKIKIERGLRRIDRLAKRFRRKDGAGDNYFASLLEHQKRQIEMAATVNAQMDKDHRRALAIVNDHTFEQELMMPSAELGGYFVFGGGASSTSSLF
jgi:curved DNA-binding protein CbpA